VPLFPEELQAIEDRLVAALAASSVDTDRLKADASCVDGQCRIDVVRTSPPGFLAGPPCVRWRTALVPPERLADAARSVETVPDEQCPHLGDRDAKRAFAQLSGDPVSVEGTGPGAGLTVSAGLEVCRDSTVPDATVVMVVGADGNVQRCHAYYDLAGYEEPTHPCFCDVLGKLHFAPGSAGRRLLVAVSGRLDGSVVRNGRRFFADVTVVAGRDALADASDTRPELAACFAAADSPSPAELTLDASLGPDGAISISKLAPPPPAPLDRCLERALCRYIRSARTSDRPRTVRMIVRGRQANASLQ